MYNHHCAPARTPELLKGPRGLVKHPQTMKSIKIYHVTRPVLQLCSVLNISMDMGLSLVASLTPELCYSSSASNSDSTILSISCLKPAFATYMFASRRACSSPVRIITDARCPPPRFARRRAARRRAYTPDGCPSQSDLRRNHQRTTKESRQGRMAMLEFSKFSQNMKS